MWPETTWVSSGIVAAKSPEIDGCDLNEALEIFVVRHELVAARVWPRLENRSPFAARLGNDV